jgi:AmmeMemoRadiSam system protein B
MINPIRIPAVAGRFYPGEAAALLAEVHSYLDRTAQKIPALGCVIPHAGYKYSGHVAGAVYSRIEIPRLCLILCPNHTGRGHPLAMMSEGSWETPLGAVPIDAELAANLKRQFPLLAEDSDAHRSEHAIEVELPFLQALRPDARFVPIALGTSRLEILQALGVAIAEVLAANPGRILIIASSDMNHYENDAITRVKDGRAIERILALDPAGVFETVMREGITMCGFGPAVVMLTAVRRLGASSADLVKYATSGDVSGDYQRVVGYAGIIVR